MMTSRATQELILGMHGLLSHTDHLADPRGVLYLLSVQYRRGSAEIRKTMVTNKLNASFFCYISDGPISESVKTIFADNYFEELFRKSQNQLTLVNIVQCLSTSNQRKLSGMLCPYMNHWPDLRAVLYLLSVQYREDSAALRKLMLTNNLKGIFFSCTSDGSISVKSIFDDIHFIYLFFDDIHFKEFF